MRIIFYFYKLIVIYIVSFTIFFVDTFIFISLILKLIIIPHFFSFFLLINLVWFENYVHNVDNKKDISLYDERYNFEMRYIKIEEQVEYLKNRYLLLTKEEYNNLVWNCCQTQLIHFSIRDTDEKVEEEENQGFQTNGKKLDEEAKKE